MDTITKTLTAATYSRYSTDQQSDDSIVDQQRVMAEYAKKNGLRIVIHYKDAAISGAALGNRPGVLGMIAAAKRKEFDVLLVNDTTRLCRSGDLVPLIDDLRYDGIRVVGVQDGYDSDSVTSDMQAGMSGIMSVEFRRMISARSRSARVMRSQMHRPVGGKVYGYTTGERKVVADQAAIVQRIFARFADGASYEKIAGELNAERVPSPGSHWAGRKVRRKSGWMTNSVKGIIENELYTGCVTWNKTVWTKHPKTGARRCKPRPAADWISYQDEALRVISNDLWARARKRSRLRTNPDARLKSGGKSRYLLSGLMRCSKCGAHYILVNKTKYGCSSHVNGDEAACTNNKLVGRLRAQDIILGPIHQQLLAPKRVEKIAKELQAEFHAQSRAEARRAQAPAQVIALDERIARLRARLKAGDQDMADDEILAAIAVAEAKREAAKPMAPAATVLKMVALLPKAAEALRAKIAKGLDGYPEAARQGARCDTGAHRRR